MKEACLSAGRLAPGREEHWSWAGPDAEVEAIRTGESRWRLSTRSRRGRTVPRASCETTFSPALIERLLQTTAPEWICDAVARYEDPEYVEKPIRDQLFAYFPPEAFAGARMLDFGCGNGASTTILGRLLWRAEIVGVELDGAKIDQARAIAAHYRLPNVRFLQSPSPETLPPDLGVFDLIMMSAVFEHLLPAERRDLMPLVWSHLRPGGSVLVNQTPHRWHPYEHHSTNLWAINYLPDRAAQWMASRYGARTRNETWDEMLRGGLRGGTEWSIRAALTRGRVDEAEIQRPTQGGLRDRADYWLRCTAPRYRALKRLVAAAFRLSDRLFGTLPSLNVDVVIRKRP